MIDDFIKYILKKNKLLGLILAGIVVISFLIDIADKFIKLGQLRLSPWWLLFSIVLLLIIGFTIGRDKQGTYSKRARMLARLLVVICCQLLVLLAWVYLGGKLLLNENKFRWGVSSFIVLGYVVFFVFEKTLNKTKNYKILFCEFSEAASEDIPTDRHITYYVYNDLQNRFEGTNISIQKLDDVVIEESKAYTLGSNADAVAIIYGIYTKVQANIKLDLRFLVIRKPEYYQPIDLDKKILSMEELDSGRLETLIGNDFVNITNFLVGLFEYSRSNFKSAINSFSNLIDNINKNEKINTVKLDVVYLYLGNSYFLQKNSDESKSCFEKALSINLHYAKAMHNIGVIEFQSGNLEKALDYFTQALISDSQLLVAYRNRAFVLCEKKRYKEALEDLLKYIASKPFDAEALRLTGICYGYLDDHVRAINFYSLARKIAKRDIKIVFDLVNEYISNKNYVRGLGLLLMQVYRLRSLPVIFGRVGDILSELNHKTLADSFYSLALVFSKKKYYLYFSRSEIRHSQGRLDLAQEDLRRAIDLEPHFADAYFNLGNIYMQKRDFSLAIQNYSKGIEVSPNFANFYFNRAQSYFFLHKYSETIRDCEYFVKLGNENDVKILELLGLSFMQLGRISQGSEHLEKAYAIAPSEKRKSMLAKAYLAYLTSLLDTNGSTTEIKRIYNLVQELKAAEKLDNLHEQLLQNQIKL
jgi:tetratricopeptide (TPR) repeat protein